ncbi:MAG: BREX-2 system ATPase PglY, partial [Mycobacterium sp.]
MAETYLRDVIDMPESVHAGDFKVELTGGFTETDARVAEYVVTEQLRAAFGKALSIVRSAVRDGASHAAYLHGSFGSGKSHFLTVLHAVLNNNAAARAKPSLQPVIAEHDEWLRGKKFLMVPYHLVGATDIDSAILGGYVRTVRALHPGKPTPPVYRADAMLADAKRLRGTFNDDNKFAEWLGTANPVTAHDDLDDLDVIEGSPVSTWTAVELDRAFTAPAGDPVRDALVSALLSGPMSSYIRGASGDAEAFIPLENGLSVITRHARDLGYDGLILFLDELILWLQAHMSDQKFVDNQVSKLVKLIESGDADRVLPVVSFISRQRDLTKLVGEDVTGSDVKNLEAQVNYLAGRFDVVNLEDRNLPAIIKERVLKPRPGTKSEIDAAFAAIESTKQADRDVLLDPGGATGASWQDFR